MKQEIKLTRKVFKTIVFLILAAWLSSCSTMYIPSNTNIPLLDEKGEKQIDLTMSITGAHVSGNYAFSDKYALMINSNLSGKVLGISDNEDLITTRHGNFAHSYGEIGIGRYDIYDSKFKMEVFSGFGYGVATDEDRVIAINTMVKYKSDYRLGFLQVNFGFRKKVFSAGGGIRLVFCNFDYTYPGDFKSPLTYQNVNFNSFNIEPLGFIRIGTEKVKFIYKVSFSMVSTLDLPYDIEAHKGIINGDLRYTCLNLSIGVNFTL